MKFPVATIHQRLRMSASDDDEQRLRRYVLLA
jgi:hypothetical protein